MNDNEYIRKAVELADGWDVTHIFAGEDWAELYDYDWSDEHPYVTFQIQNPKQPGLDALAAQLVRQALDTGEITYTEGYSPITGNKVVVTDWTKTTQETTKGPDRTMNTIKAIVDSAVLQRL